MNICLEFMDKAYKKLVEDELTEICDAVLNKITVSWQGGKYIPYNMFILKANEYIASKELPISPDFIKKYTDAKVAKNGLRILNGGAIYKSISSLINNRFFTKYSYQVKDDEKNQERTKTINELKAFFEYYRLRQPTIYTSFSELHNLLNKIGMKDSQQLVVLTSVINLNQSCYDNPEYAVYIPDLKALLNHNFKTISSDKVRKLIINNKLESFMANNDNEETEELREFMEKNSADVTYIQESCIAMHELMQKDNLTEEDKEVIKDNLAKLSFSHLTHRLIKSLENKHTEIEVEETKEIKENIVKEVKPPKFSQKQINQVYYEISKLYDLEHFKEKKILSLDEIIYLLSLMYSIEMDASTIEKFLKSVMHNYYKNNSFAILYQSYDKFKSIDDPNVQDHLDMIDYILDEDSIFTCSDEVYESIKALIANEIGFIISLVYNNYDYEIKSAKKLLKESEEE